MTLMFVILPVTTTLEGTHFLPVPMTPEVLGEIGRLRRAFTLLEQGEFGNCVEHVGFSIPELTPKRLTGDPPVWFPATDEVAVACEHELVAAKYEDCPGLEMYPEGDRFGLWWLGFDDDGGKLISLAIPYVLPTAARLRGLDTARRRGGSQRQLGAVKTETGDGQQEEDK